MDKIKVGVIGVGHLGQHHARIYSGMKDAELAGICDIDIRRARKLAKKYRSADYSNYKEMFGRIDCASVVVPTELHYQVAKDFLLNGISVLIEKPITKTVAEAEELLSIAKERGLILQVGHIERFNAAVMALEEIPGNVRFIECHRLSPFTFRSADIGVVLDLMIHDIDIILDLSKSKVKKIDAVGVGVISDKEDIANARIQFENGCVANITASRVSFEPMRKLRLFSENSYISLDYQKQEATIYKKSPELTPKSIITENTEVSTIKDLKNFVFGDLLKIEHIKMNNEEPLRKELESFVSCIKNGNQPVVSGEDGIKAIKVATIINEEINKNLKLSNISC